MCVQYIGGCSAHWGDTMSSLGDIMSTSRSSEHQGISWCMWGILWVHREMFSTSGGVQYIRGIPWVHWGDIMSTLGNIMMHVGISWVHQGMFSTSGDVQYIEGYHDTSGGESWWKPFNFYWKPQCTGHPSMYWTSPRVLMISPLCTHDILLMYSWYPSTYWTSPDVLMISPDVLNIPQCTHYITNLLMIPPNVLNIPLCTEHTLSYNYTMRCIGYDSIQTRWFISYRFQIHTIAKHQYKRIGAINRAV